MRKILPLVFVGMLFVGCNDKQEIESLKKQFAELKEQNMAIAVISMTETRHAVLKYCMAEMNQKSASSFSCNNSYYVENLSRKNNCEKELGNFYDSLAKEGRILQDEEYKKSVLKEKLDGMKPLCKELQEETSMELKKEKCKEIEATLDFIASFLACKYRIDSFENVDIDKLNKYFESKQESPNAAEN